MRGQIDPDVVAEARRLIAAAPEAGATVRLVGGVAIALHTRQALPPALERSYRDIDLVTSRKGGRDAERLLTSLGYEANDRFNAINAGRRLVFYDNEHGRQVDVFVGEFEMCHKVDLSDRLEVDGDTVPLAELLLTKLQIVKLNCKDAGDIVTLLAEHDITDHDDDAINGDIFARRLAGDWGFWRTVRGTVETTREFLRDVDVPDDLRSRVDDRLTRLWERVEREPKSFRWRQRARIGERARWYQVPEEIGHAEREA